MMDISIQKRDELRLFGLWGKTSDKTISKDIPSLSARLHSLSATKEGKLLPFIVLSKDYDPATGTSELFIGSTAEYEGLSRLTLPAGDYAVTTVRPKLGFMWGPAIGEAKRFFYTKWLPQSAYTPKNLEYELHTEWSAGKNPSIEIIFAVEAKP